MCALVACERLEAYKGGREHKGGSLSLSFSLSLGRRLYINLELEVNTERQQDAGHVCVCGGAPGPPRSSAVAVTGILSFR